jgi:nickel-dependent lactate racemase
MKHYSIPCGNKTILLEIPDHVPVQCVESHKMAPVPNVTRAVEEALSRPIGTPRLKELVKSGQTVALKVTDITRQLSEEINLKSVALPGYAGRIGRIKWFGQV